MFLLYGHFYHTKSSFHLCNILLIYFYNFLWNVELLFAQEKCDGTEVVSSIPVSEFIRCCGGSKKVFSEPDKFAKVNSNSLADNSNVFEQ